MSGARCHRIKADGKARCRQPLDTNGHCRFHGAATTPAAAQVAAAAPGGPAPKAVTAPPFQKAPSPGPSDVPMPQLWRSRPRSYWDSSATAWDNKAATHEQQLDGRVTLATVERLTCELRRDLARERAQICRDGGAAPFPNLYDDKGRLVNARRVTGHDGQPAWHIYRRDDRDQQQPPQRTVPDTPGALVDAGLARRVEHVPAWTRLSPPSNKVGDIAQALKATRVVTFRTDYGRPLHDPELAAAA